MSLVYHERPGVYSSYGCAWAEPDFPDCPYQCLRRMSMAIRKIPTTADIYLEVNGVRVAVVQSYKVTASRESKAIYAFGQSEPVSTIRGQSQYVLELTRLYATDEAIRDGLNFCDMDDFSLVVCKPDRNVIYTGCQWKSLQESAEVGGNVLEKVTVEAGRRIENLL